MENNHQHNASYHAWKWIVGILVILGAFIVGFACGRFSALFDGYGYGYYGYPMMGPWMMGGYGNGGYAVPQTQVVPPGATTTQYYYPMWRMMGGYYYPPQTTNGQ